MRLVVFCYLCEPVADLPFRFARRDGEIAGVFAVEHDFAFDCIRVGKLIVQHSGDVSLRIALPPAAVRPHPRNLDIKAVAFLEKAVGRNLIRTLVGTQFLCGFAAVAESICQTYVRRLAV